MDLPLGKKSIFGRNTNILLKASNQISVSENVSCKAFYAPKGPGTKKCPKKDEFRIREKQKRAIGGFTLELVSII